MRPVWRDSPASAGRRRRGRCRCHDRPGSPSSATVSCCPTCFARRSSARCPATATGSAPSNCPGRTSRWSTATPRRRGLGRGPARSIWAMPDDIVAFVGDAEIFVTHLAPVSTPMLDRAAEPEARRRLARRAGQHRHGRRASAADPRRQHARPQRHRRRRVHDRRHPRRDAPHPRGHEALRRGEWRGDLYRADTTGARTVRDDRRRRRLRRHRHEGGAAAARRSAAGSSSATPMSSSPARTMPTASSRSRSTRLLAESRRRDAARPRDRRRRRGFIDRAAVRAHEAGRLSSSTRRAGRWSTTTRCTRRCQPAICAAPCSRPSPSSRRRRTGRCCKLPT